MTRLAQKPMDKSLIRAMARLMHLHHQTHPDRIAKRFNITPRYVREISKEFPPDERVTLPEAIEAFVVLKSPAPTSCAEQGDEPPPAQSA
jgi:hypothetical protein